jgi:hypothetical protein
VQIVHISRDTLGDERSYNEKYHGVYGAYKVIVEILCREYGVFSLSGTRDYGDRHYLIELENYLPGRSGEGP